MSEPAAARRRTPFRETGRSKLSLFVRLEAKPGKEADVAAFLAKGQRTVWHEYWTDITPTSFVQSGDVTQPDGATVRFMNIRGTRVKKLETLRD